MFFGVRFLKASTRRSSIALSFRIDLAAMNIVDRTARFFQWYNHEHYHGGNELLTPASLHYG